MAGLILNAEVDIRGDADRLVFPRCGVGRALEITTVAERLRAAIGPNPSYVRPVHLERRVIRQTGDREREPQLRRVISTVGPRRTMELSKAGIECHVNRLSGGAVLRQALLNCKRLLPWQELSKHY